MADELIKNIQMKAVVDGQRINAYPITTIENVNGLSEILADVPTINDVQLALDGTIKLTNVGTLSSSKKYALVPGNETGVYTLSEVAEGSGSGEPTPADCSCEPVWAVCDTSEELAAFVSAENVGKLAMYNGENHGDLVKYTVFTVTATEEKDENDEDVISYDLDYVYVPADLIEEEFSYFDRELSDLRYDVCQLQQGGGSSGSESNIYVLDLGEIELESESDYSYDGSAEISAEDFSKLISNPFASIKFTFQGTDVHVYKQMSIQYEHDNGGAYFSSVMYVDNSLQTITALLDQDDDKYYVIILLRLVELGDEGESNDCAIISTDLYADDFTPVVNKYYKHTGSATKVVETFKPFEIGDEITKIHIDTTKVDDLVYNISLSEIFLSAGNTSDEQFMIGTGYNDGESYAIYGNQNSITPFFSTVSETTTYQGVTFEGGFENLDGDGNVTINASGITVFEIYEPINGTVISNCVEEEISTFETGVIYFYDGKSFKAIKNDYNSLDNTPIKPLPAPKLSKLKVGEDATAIYLDTSITPDWSRLLVDDNLIESEYDIDCLDLDSSGYIQFYNTSTEPDSPTTNAFWYKSNSDQLFKYSESGQWVQQNLQSINTYAVRFLEGEGRPSFEDLMKGYSTEISSDISQEYEVGYFDIQSNYAYLSTLDNYDEQDTAPENPQNNAHWYNPTANELKKYEIQWTEVEYNSNYNTFSDIYGLSSEERDHKYFYFSNDNAWTYFYDQTTHSVVPTESSEEPYIGNYTPGNYDAYWHDTSEGKLYKLTAEWVEKTLTNLDKNDLNTIYKDSTGHFWKYYAEGSYYVGFVAAGQHAGSMYAEAMSRPEFDKPVAMLISETYNYDASMYLLANGNYLNYGVVGNTWMVDSGVYYAESTSKLVYVADEIAKSGYIKIAKEQYSEGQYYKKPDVEESTEYISEGDNDVFTFNVKKTDIDFSLLGGDPKFVYHGFNDEPELVIYDRSTSLPDSYDGYYTEDNGYYYFWKENPYEISYADSSGQLNEYFSHVADISASDDGILIFYLPESKLYQFVYDASHPEFVEKTLHFELPENPEIGDFYGKNSISADIYSLCKLNLNEEFGIELIAYTFEIPGHGTMNAMLYAEGDLSSAADLDNCEPFYMASGENGYWESEGLFNESGKISVSFTVANINEDCKAFLDTVLFKSHIDAAIGDIVRYTDGELIPLGGKEESKSTVLKFYLSSFSSDSSYSPFKYSGYKYLSGGSKGDYEYKFDTSKNYTFELINDDPVWFATTGLVLRYVSVSSDSLNLYFLCMNNDNIGNHQIKIKVTEEE